SGASRRPHLTVNNRLMGTGTFAEGPLDSDEYRRGYLCGLIRGDGNLKSYQYSSRGRLNIVHAFRLALCDCEALLRAQDYLLDFGIATQEFQFYAANERHRESNAIRTSIKRNFAAVTSLVR